jgi:hypothetical protein
MVNSADLPEDFLQVSCSLEGAGGLLLLCFVASLGGAPKPGLGCDCPCMLCHSCRDKGWPPCARLDRHSASGLQAVVFGTSAAWPGGSLAPTVR